MMKSLKIIKIGGKVINDPELLESVLRDFSAIPQKKILVHGGGTLATELGKRLGIQPRMIDGRRITDAETLKIAQMVYAGLLNTSIVAWLQKFGLQAIGLNGADGNAILSRRRPVGEIDYGFVGDVAQVNVPFLSRLLDDHLTPVFCALTHDGQGQILNTNADTVATEIAIALSAHFETELIFTFEKQGVLRRVDDEQSVIAQLTFKQYQQLLARGIISDGMRPKLDNAFRSLRNGVRSVRILHSNNLKDLIDSKSDSGTTLRWE